MRGCCVALLVVTMSAAMAAIRRLTAAEAAAIDATLMSTPGYSIDQLGELAGLAVATAIAKTWSPAARRRVLVAVGPGNNGGDGLVAARHLKLWGYTPAVVYPKRPTKGDAVRLFGNLEKQLQDVDVPILAAMPTARAVLEDYDVAVDAVFGFSFTGAPRPPFDTILQTLADVSDWVTGIPVVSIDIPSGWAVDGGEGPPYLRPSMLVSLTAPKLCAAHFRGPYHWLGGRFVPPRLAAEYGLDAGLPHYEGWEQVVRLP